MPNFKPVAFAAAATVALTCAPIKPAAAAGPLLLAAPWALGHVIAGLARLATVASVAAAAPSAQSPAPYAPAYGYGYGGGNGYGYRNDYGAAPPAYYPPSRAYPGYVAQPRYYPPRPDYAGDGYAPPRYAAPPPAYYPSPPRYYPARSYYGYAPGYAPPSRGAYQWQRSYRGAAMRYSGAYGAPFSYRSRGFYRRR